MKKPILVFWIRPDHSHKLTRWEMAEDTEMFGVLIPSGFITDGGSIPPGFRDSFNPVGKGFPAFIAHDYRLTIKSLSRKMCDQKLLDELHECGVNKVRARLIYWAVRAYAIGTRKK